MSVAAIEAKTLDSCLREQQSGTKSSHPINFPQRFQKAIAGEIRTAWLLSTGEDLRYPETRGDRSLDIRLFNWYIRRLVALSAFDPLMVTAFFQMYHLLKPLRTLFEPRIVWGALTTGLLTHRQKTSKPPPLDMTGPQASQRPLNKVTT